MAKAYVGVSGWKYPSWRGDFYPRGLVQRRELEHVASQMTAVEVNGSFYSLQRPSTYRRFADETPDDFVFAVKGSRYVTHMKRLGDVAAGLANFFASGVLALGPKLGPFLWQLPASLPCDEAVLTAFLDRLPRTTGELAAQAARHDDKVSGDRVLLTPDADRPVRHALEPRHASYGTDAVADLLASRDVALVASDSPGTWPMFEPCTTDLVYVRLHGHTELYASGYSGRSLDRWAERCRAWLDEGRDVHVYFDNDARGHAPHDAVALLDRLRRPGAS